MFKKSQRYSFGQGIPTSYLNTELFNLRYQKNTDENVRVAIVVGKKIDQRSTVRHRLKRIFNHALKEIIAEKKPAYDLVFFLKSQAKEKDYQEIKERIELVLEKLTII